MNINPAPQRGYILVLTMIIVSLLVTLVTQMYYSGTLFSSFASVAVQREKAKMLAESGVSIACGQLYVSGAAQPEIKQARGAQSVQQEDPIRKLLEKVIPVLNTWQTFSFNRKTDGIDGAVHIYVTCEEGKIHLNDLLTLMTDVKLPENQVAALKKLFSKIAEINGLEGDLYKSAFDFFEQRKHIWLNDITELLTAPGFDQFANFVFVLRAIDKKKQKPRVFLTDLFTPQSRYGKIDPWVLSSSVRFVLGMTNPDDNKIQDRLKTALKSYKKSYNWSADWDVIFKPVYGIEYAALSKEITSLFTPDFNPVAFSVVSYATVGRVTQGVFALLLRKKQPDQSIVFIPVKSYWI